MPMRKYYFYSNPLLLCFVFLFIFTVSGNAADDNSTLSGQVQNELTSQTQIAAQKQISLLSFSEEKPQIESDEKEDKASDQGLDAGPKFFVKKINVDGVSVFDKNVFKQLIEKYENKENTFLSLKELADSITLYYRAQGYTTSRAYLPPQTIENQSVQIKIIEGKVGNVIIEGNRYYSELLYKRLMRMSKNKVFRYQHLESALYYVNRKSDRKAKAFLTPGKEPSSTDIILKVSERLPIHAYYDFNNRGTKLTHRARHTIRLEHNNLLGYDDTLNAFHTQTEEDALSVEGFSYSFPVLEWDTTFSLNGSYAESLLVKHLKAAEIKGESFSLSPSLTKTFIRRSDFNLDGYLGYEYKNSKTLINDIQINDDRMRVLVAGPHMSFMDRSGKTIVNTDIHVGLPDFMDGLDTNDFRATKINSGGEFTYYTGNIIRVQRLPSKLLSISKAGGQWTSDTLTSSEQFRLGGAFSVRGYPESEASGDYGYNFSQEIYTPFWGIPKNWSFYNKRKIADSVRLLYFIEGGKTYTRERPQETSVKDTFLLGTGFGVRVEVDEYVSFQADLGFPIGDTSSDKDNPQFHIACKIGF